MDTATTVANWSVRESAHFRLHYTPNTYADQNASTISAQAERAHRSLVDALKLNVAGSEKIDLFLVDVLPDPENAEGAVAQGSRLVDGAIWLVYTPESPGGALDRDILRVLAARHLSPKTADVPFFVDGLAAYLAQGRQAARALQGIEAQARDLVNKGGVVSIFPMLGPDATNQPNYDLLAHAFAGFLLQRNNLDQYKLFLTKTELQQRDAAAQAVYNRSLGALEEEWRASIKKPKSGGISFKTFFKQVLFYVGPFWKEQVTIFALMLIGLGFTIIMPLANAYLIDSIINPVLTNPALRAAKVNELVIFLVALFAFFVVNNLAGFARGYLAGLVNESILRRIRLQMFTKLQSLSAAYYQQVKTGDLMTRFTSDLGIIQGLLSSTLTNGIFQILTLIISSIVLVNLNWQLGLLVLAALPLLTISYSVLRDKAVAASRERQQRVADVSAALQENLNAQPVVKAFRLENLMTSNFTSRLDALFKISRRLSIISATFSTSITLIAAFIQILVLGIGGYLVLQGELLLGSLVAFLGLMGTAFSPVATLSTLTQEIQQATGAMERVIEVVEEEPKIKDKPGAVDVPRVTQGITFENVTFSYTGEQPTLNDLTLTIAAGSNVAFVGPSGAGKSSTLQMVLRFYDPDTGRVLFDGVDIKDATLKSVRDQIAIVFQETVLFNTSIRENIGYGRPGATDADIVEAAKAARMHDFILTMPRQYDTVVGERGANLSGGQRQRLSIARAILKNPAILILDEATSALDPQTEAEINETLNDLSKGRTTISITHRLSSVVTCDKIFVLERGRLKEAGSHGELVRSGGLYQRLFEEQTGYITGTATARVGVEATRLRAVPLFANLPPNEMDAIAAKLVIERHPAGEEICKQGDPGDALYIIHRGEVEVVVTPDGAEPKVLNKLHNGDYFGEIALLHDVTRTATVRTTEPTQIYSLSKTDFADAMNRLPTLGESIAKVSAQRLQDTSAKLKTKT